MRALLVAVGLLAAASPALSQVVFSDPFDAENGGVGVFDYTGFANWTVSEGSTDLIGNGFFDFYPGNGLYVDMDGADLEAATLVSSTIDLNPGQYQLSFDLGTNPDGPQNNSMVVTLGSFFSDTFDDADAGIPGQSFNLIQRAFEVTAASNLSLVFDHSGGDNAGLIIDNVSLALVPEPATLTLIAVASLGLRRRR